jgi:putative FmdB family regulatory protein
LPELVELIIIILDKVLLTPRRTVMPTYEYVCLNCGEQFTRIMSLKEFEAGQVTCPKCNSAEVKQQMSQFIPKTSRKS